MQAIHEVDELLNTSGLEYESYLSSMGRQLFYTVAASYTTFYLGIMFLIIANTVLGLKFLCSKSMRHRYSTVAMLEQVLNLYVHQQGYKFGYIWFSHLRSIDQFYFWYLVFVGNFPEFNKHKSWY